MKDWVLRGLLIGAALAPSGVVGQDTQWNRYTLEDLGGVFVRFESNDACTSVGVTAAAYEADVSLKLIEAEVGVLTQEEMLALPALPELRISLDCAKGNGSMGGAVAYSVGLRVQQAAQMLRDTQITLPESVTWFSTAVGVGAEGAVVDEVGAVLMEQIEAFAAAWAAVHETGESSG